MVTEETCFKCFIHVKSQFRKHPVLPIETISVSCTTQECDNATTLFFQFTLSSGRSREVKKKRKFQTFSSKSGRGRVREVVAYER